MHCEKSNSAKKNNVDTTPVTPSSVCARRTGPAYVSTGGDFHSPSGWATPTPRSTPSSTQFSTRTSGERSSGYSSSSPGTDDAEFVNGDQNPLLRNSWTESDKEMVGEMRKGSWLPWPELLICVLPWLYKLNTKLCHLNIFRQRIQASVQADSLQVAKKLCHFIINKAKRSAK